MQNSDLKYWLGLSTVRGLSHQTLLTLCQQFPQLEKFFSLTHTQLSQLGLTPSVISEIHTIDWKAIDNKISQFEAQGIQCITYSDLDYPERLKQIAFPPALLYLSGNRNVLHTPQIAIVGSRKGSLNGMETAKRFAFALAQAGITITSGLALGIDGASHTGALEAGGLTIAVLGTGLNHIYPAQHKELARKIQAQGALLTEYPLDTPPMAKNFPRRNRLISGLSAGVLVVEASLQSGSLITARFAVEQGREVFAIPGSIHNPASKGCHYLLKQGAKLVETVEDILEELPFVTQYSNQITPPGHQENLLSKNEKEIFATIDFEMTTVDGIIQRTGLTVETVCAVLISLELQGFIAAVPGGYLKLAQ